MEKCSTCSAYHSNEIVIEILGSKLFFEHLVCESAIGLREDFHRL